MIERLKMDDEYSPLENAIHLNRYELTKQFCKDKKILDIACGEGYGSYLMKNWGAKEVLGIDISEEAIKNARAKFKKENLKYLVNDATELKDIESDYFDMIVSFETFEHINDVEKYLKELKRVAKKDAIIIISCPNDYYYYPNENEFNPFHTKKYLFNEFKKISEKFLGKNVTYMLGMEVKGYINVLLSDNKKVKSNIEIIELHNQINSTKISADNNIQTDNCNYYIGIWNAQDIRENNVVFPYMYTDLKKDLDIMERDKIELLEEIEKLKNEKEILNKNLQKMKEVNKILSSQNEEIRKFSYDNYCDYMVLNSQLNAIYNSRSYRWTRKISNLLKKMGKKNER